MASLSTGESLKIAACLPSEVVLLLDPRHTSSPFSMGTQTLQPRTALPLHRHLLRDLVVFIHKGQGRVMVAGTMMTVVPGNTVAVPRQTWYSVRNTGTGLLQLVWVCSPPGLEEFFREASRLGQGVDPAASQELARRHGMEWATSEPPTSAEALPAGRRHRRRRRGGGRGRSRREPPPAAPLSHEPPPRSSPPQPPTAAESSIAPTPPSTTAVRSEARRQPSPRQRPRGHRRRPSLPAPMTVAGGSPPAAPSASRAGQRRRGAFRRRGGPVKEVYMGGRWIRVTGEGPVIASGRDSPSADTGSGEEPSAS